MELTKYQRLRNDCHAALAADNLEKCFELLAESLDERTTAYNDYIQLQGRLSGALHLWSSGQTSAEEYSRTLNQVRAGVLNFLNNTLKEADVSLLRRTHDRILIVAYKNSPTDWKNLFPDAFFSHVAIIRFGEKAPEAFSSPDVVIFDDLDYRGISNRTNMKLLSDDLPNAHLLYVGEENPFKDGTTEEKAIYTARMANANSRFTIHARLHELLEFRKIYAPLIKSETP